MIRNIIAELNERFTKDDMPVLSSDLNTIFNPKTVADSMVGIQTQGNEQLEWFINRYGVQADDDEEPVGT